MDKIVSDHIDKLNAISAIAIIEAEIINKPIIDFTANILTNCIWITAKITDHKYITISGVMEQDDNPIDFSMHFSKPCAVTYFKLDEEPNNNLITIGFNNSYSNLSIISNTLEFKITENKIYTDRDFLNNVNKDELYLNMFFNKETHDYVYHETNHSDEVACIVEGIFGFCGCGSPMAFIKYIRDVLTNIQNENYENIFTSDGEKHATLYMLDKLDIIDHGSVISFGWLTEDGKCLLHDLDIIVTEYDKEE